MHWNYDVLGAYGELWIELPCQGCISSKRDAEVSADSWVWCSPGSQLHGSEEVSDTLIFCFWTWYFCWAAKLWTRKFSGKFPSGLWRDVLIERATFISVGKVDIFPQMAKWWSCKSFLSRFQRVKRFSIFLARRNSSIWKAFSFSRKKKTKTDS